MNASIRSGMTTQSAARRVSEIPEYVANISRVPQTFGQVPLQNRVITDSSKVSSPNKAELLYQEAYSMRSSNNKPIASPDMKATNSFNQSLG